MEPVICGNVFLIKMSDEKLDALGDEFVERGGILGMGIPFLAFCAQRLAQELAEREQWAAVGRRYFLHHAASPGGGFVMDITAGNN